jgi:membrane dipeptidase
MPIPAAPALSKNKGLNDRGRARIHEADRLCMVIYVAHASDDAISQAIDISTDSVIATHHGWRQVNDIPRNMPDWLIKKLATKGGVIGFQIGNIFHNRKFFDWATQHAGEPFWDTKAVRDRAAALTIFDVDQIAGLGFPMAATDAPDEIKLTADGWVAVVDRAIQMVGEDHVALGTDFDGGPTRPGTCMISAIFR